VIDKVIPTLLILILLTRIETYKQPRENLKLGDNRLKLINWSRSTNRN